MNNKKENFLSFTDTLQVILIIGFFALCVKWVLPSFTLAFGLGAKVFKDGLAGIALYSWVAPVAGGVTAGGAAIGVIYVYRVVLKKAKEDPFEWLLPIISLVGGFVLDFSAELFYENNEFEKIFYKAATGMVFLGGGLLWKQRSKILKGIGTLFLLSPVIMTIAKYSSLDPKEKSVSTIHGLWATEICFLVILLVIIVMANKLRDKHGV
jgi:hypothetical protein